jgi:ferritin
MLDAALIKLINEQITKELYSAYLYLDIADYYADENLNGFENWFYVQAQEERDHAMLFRQYLLNNDAKVKLYDVAAPKNDFTDFNAPLLLTLEHEQGVTASINNIYAEAYKLHDFRTMQFLDWFVKEQGEEEKNATDLIKKFGLFGKDSKGLYMLDQELGARVYAAPTLVL